MLCRADSVGEFQLDRRARVIVLPGMRPRRFRGQGIDVAIVRPGSIQGDMVHP